MRFYPNDTLIDLSREKAVNIDGLAYLYNNKIMVEGEKVGNYAMKEGKIKDISFYEIFIKKTNSE